MVLKLHFFSIQYINRFVWKGMLKALLAIIHGLEVSFSNQCGGGLASAFQVLEIAHTHYWAKDISMTGFESQVNVHILYFLCYIER